MDLGRYRLLGQRGAGRDGVSYRAEARDGIGPVEIRMLAPAKADANCWPAVVKQLRLAALLEHPTAQRIHDLDLDHEPPFVTLEWVDAPSLKESLRHQIPVPAKQALAIASRLADVLTCAHRIGLVHGGLWPGAILGDGPANLKLDFTGTSVIDCPDRFANLDESFQAPECVAGGRATFPSDVYGLGALLRWLLDGKAWSTPSSIADTLSRSLAEPKRQAPTATELSRVLADMLATDPARRPNILEVHGFLASFCSAVEHTVELNLGDEPASSATGVVLPAPGVDDREQAGRARLLQQLGKSQPSPNDAVLARGRLGRFRILNRLGEGGMGVVYRGEDIADGLQVAVKVLRSERALRPDALRRFHKEARLLAEVNNPFVTNLLEVNEDDGIHYLVLEYVAGESLGQMLSTRGPLDEATALAVMADVARALADAHERGIVHRDIKPDNILLLGGAGESTPTSGTRVKLSDFGLARHAVETESLALTQAGAFVGTPLYMAPEQARGETATPRSDVYAMGATLFHMLVGRPPFTASTPHEIAKKHCNEPPPALQTFNSALSEATCALVARTLAKAPESRPAGAGALLRDLDRLLRGEPVEIAVHPLLPKAEPGKVLHYDWTWELESSPRQLWPHVSNTERLNRAARLSAVEFSAETDESNDVKRYAKISELGLTAAWREHPFEWVEGRRMGVLREFHQGPFKWLVSITELTPRPGGGTTLAHRVRVEPHGLLGRTAAAVKIGIQGRRAVDRIYRRMDAALSGRLGNPAVVDFFEEPTSLSGNRRRRLENLLDGLAARGVDANIVERLGEFLEHGSPQEVARMRPLVLARRWGVPQEPVVTACLHAAREGLLVLLWDILCPVCRVPSQIEDTLRAVREHGRCQACNLDFALDFANSVELIFRVHPEVRAADLGTYCIGGPAHFPHVAAQVRLATGERMELELSLPEGAYQIRGPQLTVALDFRVQSTAATGRWELNLPRLEKTELPTQLRTGSQIIVLTNEHDRELLVRVERTAPREDALTAARAASLALFRELFPGEVLSPGQLVSVAMVTLLVTDLDQPESIYEQLGDARAFTRIHENFRQLEGAVRRGAGALIKTVGEGVVAAFSEPVAAVKAGLEMQREQPADEAMPRLRVAIHRGPAMAATLNDHLDYFGSMVNQAMRLPQLVRGGEVVLTQAVAADPQVAALLGSQGLEGTVLDCDLPGLRNVPLLRLSPASAIPPKMVST